MNLFGIQLGSKFKIITIKVPGIGEVSVCPERGGVITSLKFRGKEILYIEKDTLYNKEKNVHGGIPILFPNAGNIPDELKNKSLGNLKQHGFARDSSMWVFHKTHNGFKEILIANSDTKKVYPYNFQLTILGEFEKDGSFTITQTVKNHDKDKYIPISSGLHPYFKIPNSLKKNIEFDFPGGNYIGENIATWSNGTLVSRNNPKISMHINIPNLGIINLNISKEFEKIWVWSETGKNFVCIEPIMRDKGGIIKEPEIIKPGETFTAKFNIKLKNI